MSVDNIRSTEAKLRAILAREVTPADEARIRGRVQADLHAGAGYLRLPRFIRALLRRLFGGKA